MWDDEIFLDVDEVLHRSSTHLAIVAGQLLAHCFEKLSHCVALLHAYGFAA